MKSNNLYLIIAVISYTLNFTFAQQPVWPVGATVANYNQINATFGEKHAQFHGALDLHVANNEDYLAILNGEIEDDASGNGNGNKFMVAIHDLLIQNDPTSSLKKVRYGDDVNPLNGIINGIAINSNQAIGTIHSGGHLHFEMWIRDCTNDCDWYLVDPLNNPHTNYQNQPPGYSDIYDVELNDIILEPQDNSSGIIFNQGDGLTAWFFSSCKIHKKDRPDSHGVIHGYHGSPITVFGNILPTVHGRDTEVTHGTNDTGEGLGIYECLYYINDNLKYWIRFDELQKKYQHNWTAFFNSKYNTASGQSVLYGNHDYIKMFRLVSDQYSAPHKVIDRGIWKTRGKYGNVNSITDIPQNTQYLDGIYDMDYSVLDAAGNRDDASNKINIDNFLPFITSFNLWSDIGTLFEYNRTQDENGSTLNNGLLINESATFNNNNSSTLIFPTVYVSEPMKEMFVRYSTDDGVTWSVWEEMSENATNPLMWQAGLSGYADGCTLFNFKGKDKSDNDLINVYEMTQQNTIGEDMLIPTRSGTNTWNNNPSDIGEDFFYTCTDCATQIEGITGEIIINRSTVNCDDITEFEENVTINCAGEIQVGLIGLNAEKYNIGWLGTDDIYHLGDNTHLGTIGENCYIIESLDGCCNYEGCINVTGQETYVNSNFTINFSNSYDDFHKHIEFLVVDGANLAYPITVSYVDDDGNQPCSADLISASSQLSSCSELLIGKHYCVIFEDANGCSQEYCFTPTGQTCPNDLLVTLEDITNVCNTSLGSISIAVSGNSCSDYSINWSNGQTGTQINNLSAGTYCVTVEGGSDCSDCLTVQCFDVIEEEDCAGCLEVSASVTDVCRYTVTYHPHGSPYGYMSLHLVPGSIFVSPKSDCDSYSISWDDGDLSGFERSIYEEGTYCATIHDDCCDEDVHMCWTVGTQYEKCYYPIKVKLDRLIANNWGDNIIEIDPKYSLLLYDSTLNVVYYDLKSIASEKSLAKVEMHRYEKNQNEGKSYSNKFTPQNNKPANSNISLKIYPNPFINEPVVMINAPNQGQGKLLVTDINGRTLLSKQIDVEKGQNKIKLNDFVKLPTGLLILSYQNDEDRVSIKIIKIPTE